MSVIGSNKPSSTPPKNAQVEEHPLPLKLDLQTTSEPLTVRVTDAPAVVFETSTPQAPTQTPKPVAGRNEADVAQALSAQMGPLVQLVESGEKPTPGIPLARPAQLLDADLPAQGASLTAVFSDLTQHLCSDKQEVKDAAFTFLLETKGMTPTSATFQAGAAVAAALPPEVTASVRDAMIQSGDIISPQKQNAGAPKPFEGIKIPSLSVVAMERGLSGFDLESMDVEMLAMVVMFEAGRDAQVDLKDALKEMDGTRKKKDAQRKMIQAMKEQQAETERELRSEYNARRNLPADNSMHIPASLTYEKFKEDRALEFGLSGDGHWDPALGVGFGAATEYPPDPLPGTEGTTGPGGAGTVGGTTAYDPAILALAQKYAIPPADMARFKTFYDQHGGAAKMGDFDAWLQKGPSPRDPLLGPALKIGDAATNHARISAFINAIVVMGSSEAQAAAAAKDDATRNITNMTADQLADYLTTKLSGVSPEMKAFLNTLPGQGIAEKVQLLTKSLIFEMTKLAHLKAEGKKDSSQAAVVDGLKATFSQLVQLAGDDAGLKLGLAEVVSQTAEPIMRHFETAFNADVTGSAHGSGLGNYATGGGGHDIAGGNREAGYDAGGREHYDINVGSTYGFVDNEAVGAMAEDLKILVNEGMVADGISITKYQAEVKTRAENPGDAGADERAFADAWRKDRQPASVASAVLDLASVKASTRQGSGETHAPNEQSGIRQGQRAGSFSDFELFIGSARDQLDSTSELGEQQQLRLQMYMDRLTGIHSTLSNLMKKFSDTTGGIVQNLK